MVSCQRVSGLGHGSLSQDTPRPVLHSRSCLLRAFEWLPFRSSRGRCSWTRGATYTFA